MINNLFAGSLAVILHLVLFGLVFIGMKSSSEPHRVVPPKFDIVQAKVMDETQVLEQMERLQAIDDDKKQAENDRQKKVEDLLEKTRQELEKKEQQALKQKEQDKKEQQDRDLKTKQAQEKIKELEQQRVEAENARLKAEDLKQQADQKRREAEEKQRLAEADRKAEEARKQEAEKQRKEAEALKVKAEQERKVEEARKKKAEADAREADMKRQMQELLDAEARETARKNTDDVIAKYVYLNAERIKRYWIKPQSISTTLSCLISISLLPDGSIKSVKIVESSGNAVFDRSAEAAVYKAAPLPLPTDPRAAAEFKNFKFLFNPNT